MLHHLSTKREKNYQSELKVEKRNGWAAWLQSTKNKLSTVKRLEHFLKYQKVIGIISTKYTHRQKKKVNMHRM